MHYVNKGPHKHIKTERRASVESYLLLPAAQTQGCLHLQSARSHSHPSGLSHTAGQDLSFTHTCCTVSHATKGVVKSDKPNFGCDKDDPTSWYDVLWSGAIFGLWEKFSTQEVTNQETETEKGFK